MVSEHDAPDEWEPLVMPDGRVFGVPFVRVSNYSDRPDVLWVCNAGLVQRDVEYSYWEFYFRFFRTAFQRKEFAEDAEELAEFARGWILRYFMEHSIRHAYHANDKPIWIDCR